MRHAATINAEVDFGRLLQRRPLRSRGSRRVSSAATGTETHAKDEHADRILSVASSRDRASFTALFNHFAPRVKAFLMRKGAPPSLADEIAQETMLSVWRKAEQFDPSRAGASTWIYTIARNLWIDAVRRTRDPLTLAPQEIEPEKQLEEPFAIVAREQSRTAIRQALNKLSAEQREVIRLAFFEDRTQTEIAADLGIPLGTVKSRVRLAVGKLREIAEVLQ
jgi:RNA polymerase sigma-70 factor (ECF subfamily)